MLMLDLDLWQLISLDWKEAQLEEERKEHIIHGGKTLVMLTENRMLEQALTIVSSEMEDGITGGAGIGRLGFKIDFQIMKSNQPSF